MNPIPRLIITPVVIVALLVMYGMLVWIPAGLARRRERLRCPVQLRPARVVFGLPPDGTRMDVLRCSLARRPRGRLFGRGPIICGKLCLRPPAQS